YREWHAARGYDHTRRCDRRRIDPDRVGHGKGRLKPSAARCGWHGERVEQRRGLLSERPRDGGPSRSHRGRAKKTAALLAPGARETDPPRSAAASRSENPN